MILWSFTHMKWPNSNKANRHTANCGLYRLISHTPDRWESWQNHIHTHFRFGLIHSYGKCNIHVHKFDSKNCLLFNTTNWESRLWDDLHEGSNYTSFSACLWPRELYGDMKKAILPAFYRTWKLLMQKGEVCSFHDMWLGTGEVKGMSYPRR